LAVGRAAFTGSLQPVLLCWQGGAAS